ncbi:DUF624 domain-containing protein [Bacillus sp. FJAT-49711]|uniref:YesL family protein n=1 Tax=Bacillus sp. FJAT-49711 TaxID=2833585 RepID=UPI001BC903C7|nr:DUF624 domain-containing protein [Bacillus sp. FJAT-49711]MBS4219019.1 DUF624 domain-containing protein [Bacillus sp. FJAT-49711]
MKHDGNLASVLGAAGNFAYLNALFILTSLPVFTIGPAWLAMLGVTREWSMGEDPPITATFISLFKIHFKKGLAVSAIHLVVLIILAGDFTVLLKLPLIWKLMIIPLFTAITLILIAMTLYLYPLLLNYEMTIKQLLRNSFYLSVSHPMAVLSIFVFAVLFILLSYIFRFLPFLCAFSVFTYIYYKIIHLSLIRVKKLVI